MNSQPIAWIRSDDPPEAFPDVEFACAVPDGLLAAGGDLSPERLLYAYRHGIFPWFNEDQPILWWSPDPRCVLLPTALRLSKRTRRSLKKTDFRIRINTAFDEVVACCAAPRNDQDGTWITEDMAAAYRKLHEQGWAHSIEVWSAGTLVGGLYGLFIGKVFFGESMFSRKSNASKAAMLALCNMLQENNVHFLDCQVESPHLMRLGASLISRPQFSSALHIACDSCSPFANWPSEALKISDLLY